MTGLFQQAIVHRLTVPSAVQSLAWWTTWSATRSRDSQQTGGPDQTSFQHFAAPSYFPCSSWCMCRGCALYLSIAMALTTCPFATGMHGSGRGRAPRPGCCAPTKPFPFQQCRDTFAVQVTACSGTSDVPSMTFHAEPRCPSPLPSSVLRYSSTPLLRSAPSLPFRAPRRLAPPRSPLCSLLETTDAGNPPDQVTSSLPPPRRYCTAKQDPHTYAHPRFVMLTRPVRCVVPLQLESMAITIRSVPVRS